jgi:hypothetical protein
MQAYAVILVTEHIEQMRAEAAQRRRYARATPSLRTRIATAITALRSAARGHSSVPAVSTH